MKRMINASASNPNQLPITKLSEDELMLLPDKVTLVTNVPGVVGELMFQVVSKDKILSDPDKCFFINSYWKYAYGNDVYIASKQDVEQYRKKQIAIIDDQTRAYRRYAL